MSKKMQELRGQSVEEIEGHIVDLKTELAKEKSLSVSGKKSEKPAKIRNLRRNVARHLTIIAEKKLGIKTGAQKKGNR